MARPAQKTVAAVESVSSCMYRGRRGKINMKPTADRKEANIRARPALSVEDRPVRVREIISMAAIKAYPGQVRQ